MILSDGHRMIKPEYSYQFGLGGLGENAVFKLCYVILCKMLTYVRLTQRVSRHK